MQLEITSSNPKGKKMQLNRLKKITLTLKLCCLATNPLEISTFGRTVLTLRPSETSYVKVQRICQQCQPVVVVARKGSLFNTVGLIDNIFSGQTIILPLMLNRKRLQILV